jgi:hypothetical protein
MTIIYLRCAGTNYKNTPHLVQLLGGRMGGCVLSIDMTVHTLLCCRNSMWCRQQSLHVRLLYLCYAGMKL